MKIPEPTPSERRLSARLKASSIPYRIGNVIWFTRADYYTPDLLIGNRLIVEVDGSIHDKEFKKTPDRIRHRALQNLGYYVYRVTNSQITRSLDTVVEDIIQYYYETIDRENAEPKISKITKPESYDTIPEFIKVNITQWAISFNNNLSEESWNTTYFRTELTKYSSDLVTNQSVLERFILLLLGLNLKSNQYGNLDFVELVNLFNRSTLIVQELFGEQGKLAAVHLKNMFNVSAPGFFKNLVFTGGPRIKPGIIKIADNSSLRLHIHEFNRCFSNVGVNVEESEIRAECIFALGKEPDKPRFAWIMES